MTLSERNRKLKRVLIIWRASLRFSPNDTNWTSDDLQEIRSRPIAFDDDIIDGDPHKRMLTVVNETADKYNLSICVENYEALDKLLQLNFPNDKYCIHVKDISGILV